MKHLDKIEDELFLKSGLVSLETKISVKRFIYYLRAKFKNKKYSYTLLKHWNTKTREKEYSQLIVTNDILGIYESTHGYYLDNKRSQYFWFDKELL